MATILLVEHLEASRSLAGLLQPGGHCFVIAENAWQGLAALETERVDLAVLNLDVPGLAGMAFLRDLRRNSNPGVRGLRVIVLAEKVDGGLRGLLRPLHVSAVLSRAECLPFEFLDAVRAALVTPEGHRWRYGEVA